MSSTIANNSDYLQFLNSQLPAYPSATGKASSTAAAAGGVDLSQLLAMMGGDTSALTGLTGVAGAKGSKPAKATAGQKYTRDAAASHLPPPRAPRVTATPNTAAAYASFADELQTAHQNAQASTLQSPAVKAADATSWRTPMDATGDQVATNMSQKVGGMMDGINTYQGDMMREFMALRVKNGSQGLKELGELSDLSTDIQNSQLKEQEAKSREADNEAHKAQAKASKMGIFSKLLEVVIMVITAVLAVCTFGLGLPLLAIAAAAAIAFVAAGAAKGAKDGKGFDVMGGLDVAGYVADGVMLALGVGAALLAVQTAAKTAAKGVVEEATKQMAKGAGAALEKSGATLGTDQAGELAIKGGADKIVSKESLKIAEDAGFRVVNLEKENAAKAAADKAGKEAPEAVTKVLGKAAASNAIDSSTEMTAENLLRQMNKQLAERTIKDASKITAKRKVADFSILFKGALSSNLGKLGVTGTSKIGSTILGEDFGTRMMRIGLTLGAVQGTSALGQGVMQYNTTMHQTNAEEAQAIIKLLNATVEMMNGQYDNLQNTMQNISESRSKAIDSIQSMLKSDQQINTMIANNYVSR